MGHRARCCRFSGGGGGGPDGAWKAFAGAWYAGGAGVDAAALCQGSGLGGTGADENACGADACAGQPWAKGAGGDAFTGHTNA